MQGMVGHVVLAQVGPAIFKAPEGQRVQLLMDRAEREDEKIS